MDQFRVPQRKIAVSLTLAGGAQFAGELFVPTAGRGGTPGRLGDRLNDESERFLPVASESGGLLVGKRSIVTIRLGVDDAGRENHEEEHDREVRVLVGLEGGLTAEGRVAYTLPPERSRLLDFFNAAPRFIALLDSEGATLINTDRIVEVRRLDDPSASD